MHTRVYESDAPKEAFIFLYSQSGDMQEYKMCIHRNTYAYITCTYHNVTHVGLFSHGKKWIKKLFCHVSYPITFLYPSGITSLQIGKNLLFLLTFTTLHPFVWRHLTQAPNALAVYVAVDCKDLPLCVFPWTYPNFPSFFISLQVIVTLVMYLVTDQKRKILFFR